MPAAFWFSLGAPDRRTAMHAAAVVARRAPPDLIGDDQAIQYAAVFGTIAGGSGILGRPVIDARKRRRAWDGYAKR